jgi:hypothetical protein
MLDPLARPPLRMPEMLRALRDHEIDWVLSGSTVLAVYGADVTPNDLDVVPSPKPANLRRVADLLANIDAVPAHFPDWAHSLSLQQCRAWTPQPPTLQQLDHLFVTRLGMLDVPPEITGSYAHLRAGATQWELFGTSVWICDPDEVLQRLPERPRAKDRDRAAAYAEVQHRLRTDRMPHGISRFQ